jgi:hypothetical protein
VHQRESASNLCSLCVLPHSRPKCLTLPCRRPLSPCPSSVAPSPRLASTRSRPVCPSRCHPLVSLCCTVLPLLRFYCPSVTHHPIPPQQLLPCSSDTPLQIYEHARTCQSVPPANMKESTERVMSLTFTLSFLLLYPTPRPSATPPQREEKRIGGTWLTSESALGRWMLFV